MAPFARGYVQLGESNTGLNVWCRTTTGMIRPGIFKRGTPVKVVFQDVREGLITDICVVPEDELSPAQVAKSPLLASEVDWKAVRRPAYEPSPAAADHFRQLLALVPSMQAAIRGSHRATADLANWDVVVNGRTAGQDFHITVRDNLGGVGRPDGVYVTEYVYKNPVYDGLQAGKRARVEDCRIGASGGLSFPVLAE